MNNVQKLTQEQYWVKLSQKPSRVHKTPNLAQLSTPRRAQAACLHPARAPLPRAPCVPLPACRGPHVLLLLPHATACPPRAPRTYAAPAGPNLPTLCPRPSARLLAPAPACAPQRPPAPSAQPRARAPSLRVLPSQCSNGQ